METNLKRRRILIVEDEAIIGLDIADAVEQAGGEPVGPAATIAEALQLLDEGNVKAAICDVNLPDGDIGPVLEELVKGGLPVIMHTGQPLPEHLQARFSDVLVFRKPTPADRLADAIESEIASAR